MSYILGNIHKTKKNINFISSDYAAYVLTKIFA